MVSASDDRLDVFNVSVRPGMDDVIDEMLLDVKNV